MRNVVLGLVLGLGVSVGGCSKDKAAPPEGTQLLERTKAAVDAVCACKADEACRKRELESYEAIVAEAGPTDVGAVVVEQLAKEAERIAQCTK